MIVGVDTHKHVHVAVAIDTWGVRLEGRTFSADSGGYRQLISWAEAHGPIEAFGIEGTGSYGAGLTSAVRVPVTGSSRSTGRTGAVVERTANRTRSTPRQPPARCSLGCPTRSRNSPTGTPR